MLIKLYPDQVAKHWELIRYSIEKTVPKIPRETPDKMNNILAEMLLENWECWVNYHDTTKRFNAIIVTTILENHMTETKSLLIYSIYGFGPGDLKSWLTGMTTLIKYAKFKDCVRLEAYAELDFAIKLLERYKGSSSHKFICIPV
ncbi:MAG: hypothetical protein KKD77_24485 [Gammaproteobacteria bacterium]|nr:hypothetical protein [Gammaproteobacteria bacterium]